MATTRREFIQLAVLFGGAVAVGGTSWLEKSYQPAHLDLSALDRAVAYSSVATPQIRPVKIGRKSYYMVCLNQDVARMLLENG